MKDYMNTIIDGDKFPKGVLIHFVSFTVHDLAWYPKASNSTYQLG